MAAPQGQERRLGVFFRHLETAEEFRAVEEVQRDAWGPGATVTVPAPIMRAFEDNGGLMLGAFTGATLLGFTMGFLGREGGTDFHFSHMTAVRRASQNHHLGYELKLYQREEVLAQGLPEIRWTFDPLQSKNAMLNVHRLGGWPARYLPRYYGILPDELNAGLETDRVLLVWSLASERVKERILRGPPPADQDLARWHGSQPMVQTALRSSGPRIAVDARLPEGDVVNLEVPFDLARVRKMDPGATQRWRHVSRAAFQLAFERGYAVDDFVALTLDGERRSFYLLRAGGDSRAA